MTPTLAPAPSSSGFGGASIVSTSTAIDLGTLPANTSNGPRTLSITRKSSAFEVVPAAACTVTTTERGFPRPGAAGKNCDAGAYAYQLTGYDLVGSDGGVCAFDRALLGIAPWGLTPPVHVTNIVGAVPNWKLPRDRLRSRLHARSTRSSIGAPSGGVGSMPCAGWCAHPVLVCRAARYSRAARCW